MRFFSRFLIALSVVVMLVALCVAPAAAVSYDYNDYITNIYVDGDKDICTVEIPFNGTWIIGTTSSSGSTSYSFYSGNNAYVPLTAGARHSIGVSPFRNEKIWDNTVGSYLSPDAITLKDIPAGATFKVEVNVGVANGNVTVQDYSTHLYYVEQRNDGFYLAADQDRILTTGLVDDNGLNVHINTHPKSIENKGDAFLYSVWLGNVGVQYTGDTLLACKTIMSFSISSAYREYTQNGKNAALLKAIDDQLKANGDTLADVLSAQGETNDKLDDIITGTVTPERPSGSDSFDDLNDAESSLRDDAQSALDEFLELNDITHEGLEPYLTSLFAVSYIFELFSELPFFAVLLGVSLCLGLTGTILGISQSLVSKFSYRGGK